MFLMQFGLDEDQLHIDHLAAHAAGAHGAPLNSVAALHLEKWSREIEPHQVGPFSSTAQHLQPHDTELRFWHFFIPPSCRTEPKGSCTLSRQEDTGTKFRSKLHTEML